LGFDLPGRFFCTAGIFLPSTPFFSFLLLAVPELSLFRGRNVTWPFLRSLISPLSRLQLAYMSSLSTNHLLFPPPVQEFLSISNLFGPFGTDYKILEPLPLPSIRLLDDSFQRRFFLSSAFPLSKAPFFWKENVAMFFPFTCSCVISFCFAGRDSVTLLSPPSFFPSFSERSF